MFLAASIPTSNIRYGGSRGNRASGDLETGFDRAQWDGGHGWRTVPMGCGARGGGLFAIAAGCANRTI
jgi:hypothetical protein